MQRFLLKFIGLIFLFFVIEFQSQNFQLSNYSLKEGLPQSQVNAVIQDAVGYLWFGTQGGGICRFDGNEFIVFDKSNGLISNHINDIKYNNGTLYIATNKGISLFENGKFINYSSPNINKIQIKGNVVFLGTNNGLKMFDGVKIAEVKLSNSFGEISINDIKFHNKYLWLATNKGLWKVAFGTKISHNPKLFSKGDFISLKHFRNQVYAINADVGISVFDKRGSTLKELMKDRKVLSFESIKNEFWISTASSEVLILKNTDYSLIKRYNRVSGINSNIQKIFKDRQDNYWLATNGKGVYKLKEHNFELLFEGNQITSTTVNTSKQTTEIWFSSNQYLTKIDSLRMHDKSFGKKVTSIAISKKLIFAATNSGLYILDSSGVIDRLTTDNGLISNTIEKVIIDKDIVWLTSKNKGVTSFYCDSNTKSQVDLINYGTNDGIYDLSIKDIVIDKNNKLWYVSEKGFFGYIDHKIVKHLGQKLNTSFLINMLMIHDNKLFVGTLGDGIWMADLSDDLKFKNITEGNQLNSMRINQMLFDADNNLWAGTQRGVYKINLSANYDVNEIIHFGYNDGFKGVETTGGTAFMDKETNLYFGTVKGLAVFKAKNNLLKDANELNIAFENVEVVYNKIDTINLVSWTNSSNILNLKPEENHVSFSYKSVDINYPKGIKYRWRLNTETWGLWSFENRINFANLSAGNYLFEVESQTINHQKSDAIRFNFHIETKLINKLWFRLSVLSVLMLILIYFIWNYIKDVKIKASEKNEKLKLQNHLLTLEHKALQLQMNPHFIFNVLNGIKAMSKTDSDKMNKTINTFALMLRGVLNNARKETISLQEEIETLKNYIEVEQLMRKNPFDFKINIADTIDIEEVLIHVMLIQPFVENAIKHGFSNLDKIGALEINFSVKRDLLYCEIKDNGVGIYHSKINKSKTSHQSVALEVTKQRIESIAGKNTLEIRELKDIDSNIVGTIVQFAIPLLTDY